MTEENEQIQEPVDPDLIHEAPPHLPGVPGDNIQGPIANPKSDDEGVPPTFGEGVDPIDPVHTNEPQIDEEE